MTQRQQDILRLIIEQYIDCGIPVSSKYVSSKFGTVSPATVRNEMATLEEMGYIFHPHTSAGRVPSEKGYALYVEKYLNEKELSVSMKQKLYKSFGSAEKYQPQNVKSLAKEVAELSNNAVFVAFAPSDFYYTGLSNLFSQPEFVERQLLYRLTRVIDHFDQVIYGIVNGLENEIEILLGENNPFSPDCGTVLCQIAMPKSKGVFGIIGPMRMDYQRGYSLIKQAKEIINNAT